MGLSQRIFLVAAEDRLLRLPGAKFDRMLREPALHRLAQFAGQRVKMASITVELVAGEPVRVVRRSFAVLDFDRHGALDIDRFGRQQAARFEAWLAPEFGETSRAARVTEAASRFVAQGATGRRRPALAAPSTGRQWATNRAGDCRVGGRSFESAWMTSSTK
jgi:hypothetical protein